ncbi:HAD hydrolase-like protein [Novosphingobium sp.]|uniref:HAD hydrolase-like protein n=1 Tax=Novosphingobium sp. TaxID=1874826 RepID=UPI00286EA222|nr:HAD hydrolase-like protein [Novosphingobium sp.]
MSQRLAVFDCDGTLVDGQASICEAMEAAFAEAGLPTPDRHAVRRIVGLSLPQAVRRLVPDCAPDVEALAVDAYKRAYRTAREEGRIAEPLFDGIAELIEKLYGAGWLLGVATGKSDRGLSHCLAAHGLTHKFATLQTADRHPSKPHPAMMEAALGETLADPARTVMIGDTAFDMGLAVNSGVRAIGVAWGYHEPAELVAAGAEWVAQTPVQLGEYLLS